MVSTNCCEVAVSSTDRMTALRLDVVFNRSISACSVRVVSSEPLRRRRSAESLRKAGAFICFAGLPPLEASSSTSANREKVELSMKNNSKRKMISMSDVIDTCRRL